jgi:hypothetical protein
LDEQLVIDMKKSQRTFCSLRFFCCRDWEKSAKERLQEICKGFDLCDGIHGGKADSERVTSRAERSVRDRRTMQTRSRTNAVIGELFGYERR